MKTCIIYEPKGRALEYAPLACNLAIGCPHGCLYCYGPGAFRRSQQSWVQLKPKRDVERAFTKAAEKFAGDPRPILFSFGTDPCVTPEAVDLLQRVMVIAQDHGLKLEVLTKNPMAAERLFETMALNGWGLGVTVCFLSEHLRKAWEPFAPSIESRLIGLGIAKAAGVRRWVSVEPVVDVDEGMRVIEVLHELVDLMKVGKWNHDARAVELPWGRFLAYAAGVLAHTPRLFKVDLLEAAGYVQTAEDPNVWHNERDKHLLKADSRK